MSKVAALVIALLATLRGCGESCLVDLDVGEARARVTDSCCECLEQSSSENAADSSPTCAVTTLPVDAGVPSGEAPCLCGGDAQSCSSALQDGRGIELIGACVVENGPCADACADLLAFP